MCTHPFAKEALTLHLARGEGHKRYFDCNLMRRKVLASSHQHLMAEAPRLGVHAVLGRSFKTTNCLESVNCSRRGTLREGRPPEELEPTPALVGNGARRHRTALEEGGGLPPSSQASRSSQAGTEDRGEDINRIEEEGRLNVSRGEFQLRIGLDSPRATRRPTSLLSCGCLSRYVRVPSEPPPGFRIVVALTSAGGPSNPRVRPDPVIDPPQADVELDVRFAPYGVLDGLEARLCTDRL